MTKVAERSKVKLPPWSPSYGLPEYLIHVFFRVLGLGSQGSRRPNVFTISKLWARKWECLIGLDPGCGGIES